MQEQKESSSLLGMIADHPTPKIMAEDGVAYTLNSRDYKGVMVIVLSGTDKGICGQEAYTDMFVTEKAHDIHNSETGLSHESPDTDSICVDGIGLQRPTNDYQSRGGEINAEPRTKELRILWETYGKEAVLKWGIAIMERIQQAEVLQQGMHECSAQTETETWDKLGDNSLPCPELVAEWVLRDMWKRQERGCTPQGSEPTEQLSRQFAETMPKLPYENPSSCEEMFNLWRQGKGIRVLQQTLHQIQEIWKSTMDEWKGGEGMNGEKTAVRRLTPL